MVFLQSANNFRSNRQIWLNLYHMMSLVTPYHIPAFRIFGSLRSVGAGKRVPGLCLRTICLGHNKANRCPWVWNSKFKLPSTRSITNRPKFSHNLSASYRLLIGLVAIPGINITCSRESEGSGLPQARVESSLLSSVIVS